jgi:rRNA maturation endonuclease Nob1
MFSGIAFIALGLVSIAISGVIESSEPKPIPNSNLKFCSGCGNEIKSNDTYCPKCGNKL